MDLNNNMTNSTNYDSESESDIEEFMITNSSIDVEDLKKILSIPPDEDLSEVRISIYKHIYQGCKDPHLVKYYNFNVKYCLDDIPKDLIEKFRKADEEGEEMEQNLPEKSTSSKTVSSLNLKRETSDDEQMVFKETESLKINNLLQLADDKLNSGSILSDLKNDANNIGQINVADKHLTVDDDNRSQSQAGFSTRSQKNSQISSHILNSKDCMSLSGQIRSVEQPNYSFRITQKTPRYEFYNEQRNFKKQLHNQSESQSLLANQLASMNMLLGLNNQNQGYIQNQHFINEIKSDNKINSVEELYQNFDLKYFT